MDKAALRQHVWDRLAADGVARFPFPPHGRIPNFAGADAAAERLASLDWWAGANALKCNPDSPQRPVRARALAAGKTVVMARPRLRGDRPFIELDPNAVADPTEAATIGGAEAHGRPLTPADVPPIDGIVTGCVAVDGAGRRIGKGEGYSDLEFAILLTLGVIEPEVTVATTVHEHQVLDGPLPTDAHDVPVDVVATPDDTWRAIDRPSRPTGIDWGLVDAGMRDAMPVLDELAGG